MRLGQIKIEGAVVAAVFEEGRRGPYPRTTCWT